MNHSAEEVRQNRTQRPRRSPKADGIGNTVQTLLAKGKEALRVFWYALKKPEKAPYQHPAHGLAVTGFVLILVSVIFWGWLPLLTFLGLACELIALARGNRSGAAVVGFLLAIFALVLAYGHAGDIRYLAENPRMRDTALTEAMDGAFAWLEEFLAKLVSKLSSLASGNNS